MQTFNNQFAPNPYNIALLHQNQLMKKITINEALLKITALMNKAILKTVDLISASFREDRNLLLISAKPAAELALYPNHLAIFIFNKWNFIKPSQGTVFFSLQAIKLMVYENSN